MDFPLIYLNGNDGRSILAWGKGPEIRINSGEKLDSLDEFKLKNEDKHLFGYLGYDLKNSFYELETLGQDLNQMPDLFFWCPPNIAEISNGKIEQIIGQKNAESLEFIKAFLAHEQVENQGAQAIKFNRNKSKSSYLNTVRKLQEHILRGDIYEVNFCQLLHAEKVHLKEPISLYWELNKRTKAPFSSYLHFDHFHVFSGSPERFLKRTENNLLSEPIKGTASRGKNEREDQNLINELRSNPKERAENIMIVDLVRNDFSRIDSAKNVYVNELCEIYSFLTVHQMISKVTCNIAPEEKLSSILQATFPMGSMTGAPKKRAMELIEEHEDFKRGIYSGSIGYIAPNGDFDFNVVIRSLVHNETSGTLTCAVGSAITHLSEPEKEWEECNTKINKLVDDLFTT